MSNSGRTVNTNRHYLAMALAVLLIVLLLFEFASFAVGAYFVFNQPISNVVAQTGYIDSNAFLNISATGLNSSSSRVIWVDPQVTYDASGTAFVNVSSGFKISNATTSQQGSLDGTYSIPNSTLQQIESDGQRIHSVWITGVGQTHLPGEPQFANMSYDAAQNYTASTIGRGITLFVLLYAFVVPFTFNLGQIFLLLWTVYIILFAIALNGPVRNLYSAMKTASRQGVHALMDNSMFATLIVFPIVLWVTVLLALIQQAGGISTGNLPTIDPLLEFVSLSIAPIREEIGFRVIPIGIAALVVLFHQGKFRDGLLALWHPARYLKKNDSPRTYRRHMYLIYGMIAFSALVFGLAHVLLGAGWGPGKILDAAVAGVALGGLYYYYGLPSAILLHWSIDYFLTVFYFTPALSNIGNLVTIYTMVLAVTGSLVLVALFIRKLRNRRTGIYLSDWGSNIS